METPAQIRPGDRVRYANDPHGPLYTVVRVGEAFIMITDNIRTYPKSSCFNVPRGTVLPETASPAAAAPSQKKATAPAAAVPDYGKPKTAEEFQAAAAALGARPDQLAELREIWHQPAPNGGVRVMRCRNYIRNRICRT